MIQELREYSKTLFFKLLMGVIAITFVLSFGVGGFFGDRKEVVAKVNNNEILLKEYREAYQIRLSALREQFGKNADQFAEKINLRQQVFNQLIDRYILLNNADDLNLVATDLEIQNYIKKQPYFQRNGRFDYNTYESVLNQNRIVRYEYENSLRSDILLNKKKQLLTAGLIINDKEVEQAYRRYFEKIELDYVFFDPKFFLENTKINDSEIRNHYQKHKDKFKTLNKFRIDYFKISTDFFKGKLKIKEREIRRYYKKNIENYITPQELKARHILVKIVPNAEKELVSEKRNQLKNLLKKIKAGESFEEIAKLHSEDGSSVKGGDLGWFSPGEMVPAFEDAAFSLEIGQVSEIVRSPFGFHLIKLDDRKDKVTKSIENVRDEIMVILLEKRALKNLKEETDRFIGIDGDSFFEEAKKLNKEIQLTDWFDKTSVIPEIGSASELVTKLLQIKPGQIGVWRRNPVIGDLIYRLNDTKEPEIMIFENAKEDVFADIRSEKAELMAIQTAKDYFSKVKNGASIEELIEKHGLKNESIEFTAKMRFLPKIGDNEEFRKVGLNLNDKNKYGLSTKENRAYLIHFKNRTLNNENNSQKAKIRSQLLENMQQALLIKELKRLRKSASIEILNPLFVNQSSS